MAKTTEQMLIEAKTAGVEITVTTRPKRTAEVVLLPGLRARRSRDGNKRA